MARRRVAVLLYVTAGAVAVLDPNTVGLALATASVVLLTVGYRLKRDFVSIVSGWFLYLPLAAVLFFVFGPFWSYLASGVYIAAITERLSFENQLSVVLEAPEGVDAEAKRLAADLSSHHLRRLATVLSFVAAIGILSAAVSTILSAVTILILASVMVLIALGMYAVRSARGAGPDK